MQGIRPSPAAASLLVRLADILSTEGHKQRELILETERWLKGNPYRVTALLAIALIICDHSTLTPAGLRTWAQTMRSRTMKEYQ